MVPNVIQVQGGMVGEVKGEERMGFGDIYQKMSIVKNGRSCVVVHYF
jgi:hypothetical protein